MSDTSKTAKIIKRSYHSPSHRLTVNVLLNNITFLWFLLFLLFLSCQVNVMNWWRLSNHFVCLSYCARHWLSRHDVILSPTSAAMLVAGICCFPFFFLFFSFPPLFIFLSPLFFVPLFFLFLPFGSFPLSCCKAALHFSSFTLFYFYFFNYFLCIFVVFYFQHDFSDEMCFVKTIL